MRFCAGPAVLLYGSQAIGGAVNVIDRAHTARGPPNAGYISTRWPISAAQHRNAAAARQWTLHCPPNIVAHVDGSYRASADLRSGGYVYAPALRADLIADAAVEAAEGHAEEAADLTNAAALRGDITNSATETYTLGAGLGLITDGGSLGFSLGLYDTQYGVPARPGTAHAHGAEEPTEEEGGATPVTIDMRQIRADLRAQLTPHGAVIDAATCALVFADYTHTEFEGEEVGTIFNAKGMEGRLEIAQSERGADGAGSAGFRASPAILRRLARRRSSLRIVCTALACSPCKNGRRAGSAWRHRLRFDHVAHYPRSPWTAGLTRFPARSVWHGRSHRS